MRNRKRQREKELPPSEREVLRQRHNIHAARYRATHRLDLLAYGMRYRQEINPGAYPRVVSLRRPEEYTEPELIFVGVRDAEKRRVQDRVKGMSSQVVLEEDADIGLP